MSALEPVSDDTFDELVLRSDRVVAVDFWADWCPYCPAVAKLLAGLAEEFGERARIVSLNYDDNPRTGLAYRVMSLPTVLVFRDSEPVASIVGLRPVGHFRSAIEAAIEATVGPAR